MKNLKKFFENMLFSLITFLIVNIIQIPLIYLFLIIFGIFTFFGLEFIFIMIAVGIVDVLMFFFDRNLVEKLDSKFLTVISAVIFPIVLTFAISAVIDYLGLHLTTPLDFIKETAFAFDRVSNFELRKILSYISWAFSSLVLASPYVVAAIGAIKNTEAAEENSSEKQTIT